jgi:hypothetical protein
VNVDEVKGSLEELAAAGVPRVPALIAEGGIAQGWNPPAYAALLGVPYRSAEKMSPKELAERLDLILEVTERLMAELPRRALEYRAPERDRCMRDLGYHVFRLSLAFVDAMDLDQFPQDWLNSNAPPEMVEGPDVARYGALVRARIGGWFDGAGQEEFARTVAVYYGPQSAHELLERTTWHAGQHLRQLYAVMGDLGIRPTRPLPEGIFDRLPLPASLW